MTAVVLGGSDPWGYGAEVKTPQHVQIPFAF